MKDNDAGVPVLFVLVRLPSSTLNELLCSAFALESRPGLETDMELWTEYEGRTIDGAFPLGKLLQPEGRSAFFSTPNGTGTPTVIRLIESHFDDEEILTRWRGVEALHHPNLVKLKQFGKAELDGTALVYAVMEPAEANLGEIVAERRLTPAEATQIATSLVAALDALHTNGFVHEHVEPGNVFAVGEEIKLRSDCIREAPEGGEGRELKRRDVRDLAVVLLRALTQRRTLEEAAEELPLTAPFEAIVRKGISGEWGLTEIADALAPAAAVRVEKSVAAASPVERSVGSTATAPSLPVRRAGSFRAPVEDAPEDAGMRRGLMAVLGLSVLVLALIAWYLIRGHSAEEGRVTPGASAPVAAAAGSGTNTVAAERPTKPSAALTGGSASSARARIAVEKAPSPPVEKAPSPPVVKAPVAAAASAPVAAARSASSQAGAASGAVQWRVIAFTYNHEDQAKAKAARVAGQHPDLRPEVFTPNGNAPYLVTIGGAMGRDDAYALARKAREEGLARDVYAQNYRGETVSPAH